MNSSDSPSRVAKAFSVNGSKNTIPVDSTPSTISGGIATFDSGFPPVTMQPLSAGGIPPSGMDFNGVLYSVTLQQQWQNAGMAYPFSQTFSDAISGYPKGSVIPNSSSTGQWLNLNESNITSPESSSGASTGWVPLNNYGVTSISGVTSGNVVLSSNQASKDRIIITGSLSGNVIITLPSWIKSWKVYNNTTGEFSFSAKTLTGNTIPLYRGENSIFCDGINLYNETKALLSDFASVKNQNYVTGKQPDGLFFVCGYGKFPTDNNGNLFITLPQPFPNRVVYNEAHQCSSTYAGDSEPLILSSYLPVNTTVNNIGFQVRNTKSGLAIINGQVELMYFARGY